MKMKVLVFAAVAAALVFLTSCNKEIIDTTYKYDTERRKKAWKKRESAGTAVRR